MSTYQRSNYSGRSAARLNNGSQAVPPASAVSKAPADLPKPVEMKQNFLLKLFQLVS